LQDFQPDPYPESPLLENNEHDNVCGNIRVSAPRIWGLRAKLRLFEDVGGL
jgi:hypothetical protein